MGHPFDIIMWISGGDGIWFWCKLPIIAAKYSLFSKLRFVEKIREDFVLLFIIYVRVQMSEYYRFHFNNFLPHTKKIIIIKLDRMVLWIKYMSYP